MAIKPINGHVLIEPVKHESFISSQKETYQEIGVVIALPELIRNNDGLVIPIEYDLKLGVKVLFDAWLAKKYPKEGSDTEYYWLVRYSDIVAYDDEVSE